MQSKRIMSTRQKLIIAANQENDIVSILRGNHIDFILYNNMAEALKAAPDNAALMVLAEGCSELPAALPANFREQAAQKKLKLYMEYPATIPGVTGGEKHEIKLERAVIASDDFGNDLPRLMILTVPGSGFVTLNDTEPVIVLAKVAGFDRAVYGLPAEGVFTLLGRIPGKNTLVSALKLSSFITGRFSPVNEWTQIWKYILNWLVPGLVTGTLKVIPSVSPSYSRTDAMPVDAGEQTLRRGAEWFFRAKMLVDESWEKEYWKFRPYPGDDAPPRKELPCGDGSLGVMEGFNTIILPDGTQPVMWYRRADCNGTTAGALAAAGAALGDQRYIKTGANISDFLMFRSLMAGGNHANPQHPAFGLLGWHDREKYHSDSNGFDIHYGDDNASATIGLLTSAAIARTDRWDRRIMQCLMANFRTTGKFGFRPGSVHTNGLVEQGWKHFYDADYVEYSPHFQAYPWACFLWAYRRTGWKNLLTRTKTAIRMTMEAYPDKWKWTNGIQQERARFLLPLSWLIRLDDTAEHRGWLNRIADDMLACQDSSGAIREELGNLATGLYGPQKSNEEYGKSEAPLIHENGDPACDLLYTMPFAAIGLNEAAHATGERRYREASDRMADFFCRNMTKSVRHPQLDGGWYRGFDFARWDFGGSNSDRCWGVYCMETGWIQGWILLALALRKMNSSLWTLTQDVGAGIDIREFDPMFR